VEEGFLCVIFDRTNGVLLTSCQWLVVSEVEIEVKQRFIRMLRVGKSTIVVHKLSFIYFILLLLMDLFDKSSLFILLTLSFFKNIL